MWKKGLYFWGPAEISNNKVIHFERAQSRVLKFLPGFALALALAIVGLLLLFLEFRADRKTDEGRIGKETSRRFELTVLLLVFVAAYFATHLPFFIAGRYRIPIIPILLLFGAYGIERVRLEMTARRVKKAAIWMGVLIVAYLATSRQLAEYRPDLGMWHFDRGDAYRKQGQVELAQAEFQKAVELSNEPSPLAYNNLGAAMDQLGRPEEAVGYFERALEIKPDYLEARRNLVSVLLRMKRADLAYEHQLEIVRLDPRDAVARFNLGINLLLQSRLDDAIGRFSEAVELDPSYYNAQYHLARSLAMAGRTKEATARYLIVMRLGEGNVEARFELAGLLAKTGDKQQAITHLRRVLAARPDHTAARQLLAELESD
jgi:tetratricopeptide (TPR) repeat protein